MFFEKKPDMLAYIPLDIFNHSGMTIYREYDPRTIPDDVKLAGVTVFPFTLGGFDISTRLLEIQDDERIRLAIFQPICVRGFRWASRSWRGLSRLSTGVLKDCLVQEGWCVNLPL